MNRNLVIILILSLAAIGGGYLLYQNTQMQLVTPAPTTSKHGNTMISQQRPDFSLPDMEGVQRHISEWDGKVLLINFWASWCPPCRREIPAFIELQDKYGTRGFQIIGIAIDTHQNIQDYMDTMGVNYPVLIGELESIEIAKRYGNRFGALPYSLLVDRQGKITFIQRGELLHEVAEAQIKPLL